MFSRFGGAEKSSSSEIGSELKEIGRTPPTDSLECFSQRGTDDGEVGRQRQPQQPLFHGGIWPSGSLIKNREASKKKNIWNKIMIVIISFFGLILSGGWAYDELDCSGVQEVSRDREIRIKKSHLVNGKCKIRYFWPKIQYLWPKNDLNWPKNGLIWPKMTNSWP